MSINWMAAALLSRDPVLYPVESPLPKVRLPPEPPIVLEDAEIRWGKPSQFNYGSRQGVTLKYNVNWGDDEEDEEEKPEVPTLVYTEIEGLRKATPIKVTSDQDPDVWVTFGRIDEIVFEGPDSLKDPTVVRKKYVLKHPAAA